MADSTVAAGNPGVASRREFLIGGALGGAAILAGLARPQANAASESEHDLARMLPDEIGQWTNAPYENLLIPKGEDVEETYDDVVTRYYTSASAPPVILLIAYGGAQAGEAQLHRPEVCYPAAGFKLRDWPDTALRLNGEAVTARSLTASAPGRTEQILYWTRIGRDFPTSSLGQRWSILRQSLTGQVPDGVLVRLSAIDPDRSRAVRTLDEFATAMVQSGGSDLRRLLTGKA